MRVWAQLYLGMLWRRQVDTRNHNSVCLCFPENWEQRSVFMSIFQKKKAPKGCVNVSLTYSIYETYEQFLWADKHLCTQKNKTFLETTRPVGSHVFKNTLCIEVNMKQHSQPISLYTYWCANTIFEAKHKRGKSTGIHLHYLEVFGWEGSVASAKIKSYPKRSMLLHFDWFRKSYKNNFFNTFLKNVHRGMFTIRAVIISRQGY